MRLSINDIRFQCHALFGLKRSERHESESNSVKSDQVREDQAEATTPVDQNTSNNNLINEAAANRVFKTVCLLYSALTVGWCTPLLGNTLVHMEYFFNVSTATMSIALTVQALGGLFGAIICGLVFDHVNHELAFVVACLFQGLSYILAPYVGGIVPFIVAVCFQATSIGFIIASGQTYCVGLWKGHRYRDPLIHSWHAVWSLGGTIGPFIVTRFLVDLPQQHQTASATGNGSTHFITDKYRAANVTNYAPTEQLTNSSYWNLSTVDSRSMQQQIDVNVPGLDKVRYAYVTIGSLTLVSHILFVIAFLLGSFKSKRGSSVCLLSTQSSREPTDLRSKDCKVNGQTAERMPRSPRNASKDIPTVEDSLQLDRHIYLILVVQVFLFFHVYRYEQAIQFMYMPAFVVKHLNFSVQNASLLMSLFFGFQFVARVIGIPVAAFVRPQTMVLFNVSSTAVFCVLLLAFVKVWPTIIWITAPLASFAMATTLAAGMLWISERVTITGRLSGVIFIGHSTGAIIGPLIVGQLFETSTPMWFVYVLAASSVSHMLLTFVLMCYDRFYGDRIKINTNAGVHSNDDVAATSRKNSGYNSVCERDDRLEFTANIEASEVDNLPLEKAKSHLVSHLK